MEYVREKYSDQRKTNPYQRSAVKLFENDVRFRRFVHKLSIANYAEVFEIFINANCYSGFNNLLPFKSYSSDIKKD